MSATPRPTQAQRLASEALGTAFLLATIVGSGIMAQRLAGGNVALALLGNTIPTGAILVVLILIFGPISGAHLNPAVSLAMTLRRALPARDLAPFVAAQIAGGVAGVLAAHAMSTCRYCKSRRRPAPARRNGLRRRWRLSACC